VRDGGQARVNVVQVEDAGRVVDVDRLPEVYRVKFHLEITNFKTMILAVCYFFYTSESPQRQSPKYGYLVQSKADYLGLGPVFGIFKLLIIILILFLLFLAWSFLPVIALS
jgi:hypothetical protein